MKFVAAFAIQLVFTLAAVANGAGLEVQEYEDALLVVEDGRTAMRISLERDISTSNARVRIATLYDPYGEPYVSADREPHLPAALDWGVENCRTADRTVGPYIGESPYRTFERWSHSQTNENFVELEMQRAWLDPATDQAFVLETARVTVHAQQFYRRAIDIRVRLVNVGADTIVIPGDAGFVARFDSVRPQAGIRTPENAYRKPPVQYRGAWLSASSVSLSRMKMMGIALFNDALRRGNEQADFSATADGALRMSAADRETVLAPGEATEWSLRVFLYADELPARAIQDSYVGFLTGRTW